jgi:sarcosine oxidase
VTAGRRHDWDAIVVGLGGIGSGGVYWLSKRLGEGVLGLEQFELGHANGASHDHSRIIRLSYHRPDYVRLAQRAYATWRLVEADAGTTLVTRTGGLDIAPEGSRQPLADYSTSMEAEGVLYERLEAREIMRRWPQWRLGDEHMGLFQADAGIVDPNRANVAHQRLARAHGATLLDNARVTGVRENGGEIDLTVNVSGSTVTYRTALLVLATDAWTNDLLGQLHRQLPLTITQEQVTYFSCRDLALFAPERFPIWIWLDLPSFYGFPVYGEAGPKAGEDVGGRETTANERTFEPDQEARNRLRAFLAERLPDALGPEIYTKTCLYTLTPDRDFIVDRLPDHPGVLVALGAAHGYKYASVLGRILTELAVDGSSPSAGELEAFRIDRPVLLEPNPEPSFMV